MGHLGGDVHVAGPAVGRVEVGGERVPAPVEAFVECRTGDVLDPLHQLDQAVVVIGADRGEPHPAVAHHQCRTPCQAEGVREESHMAWPS